MNEPLRVHRHDRKGVPRAAAALFGTMVGAGIFALPHAVERSGAAIGAFWLLSLAAVALLTHLLFGEVVMRTPGRHRLVGYVGVHLGRWQKQVQAFASILGLVGGSLAYLILGGLFLSQLAAPVVAAPPMAWSLAMFVFVAFTVWQGVNFLSRVDFWLSIGLAVVLILIIGKSFLHLEPSHLAEVEFSNAFLPYGLVLFAYGGLSAITEMKDMLERDRLHGMRLAVVLGTLAACLLTALFAISTVGALGPATTEESIAGLAARFGGFVPMIGAAAGFLAVITSYVVFSLFLREQFQLDFGWPRLPAWAFTMFVPLGLFLAGVRSFGTVLEIVGSVLGGVQGIFVCWLYLAVRKKMDGDLLKVPTWLVAAIMLAYAAGAAYELSYRLG